MKEAAKINQEYAKQQRILDDLRKREKSIYALENAKLALEIAVQTARVDALFWVLT